MAADGRNPYRPADPADPAALGTAFHRDMARVLRLPGDRPAGVLVEAKGLYRTTAGDGIWIAGDYGDRWEIHAGVWNVLRAALEQQSIDRLEILQPAAGPLPARVHVVRAIAVLAYGQKRPSVSESGQGKLIVAVPSRFFTTYGPGWILEAGLEFRRAAGRRLAEETVPVAVPQAKQEGLL